MSHGSNKTYLPKSKTKYKTLTKLQNGENQSQITKQHQTLLNMEPHNIIDPKHFKSQHDIV